MARKKHPKKDIEEALVYAQEKGWRVSVGGGHAWGKLYCPYNDRDCRCGEFCMEHTQESEKSCQTNLSGC